MIGEIELRVVETDHVKSFSVLADERGAETTTRAEDCDFHFFSSGALRAPH